MHGVGQDPLSPPASLTLTACWGDFPLLTPSICEQEVTVNTLPGWKGKKRQT